VDAAYGQLASQTDRLFESLFSANVKNSTRICFTRIREPYISDGELISAVRSEHILEVTTAARQRGRLHPWFNCDFGGAFDRFRAVHDFVGHVRPGSGFDLEGECHAWFVQDSLLTGLARWALATEVFGVNCARRTYGDAPELKAILIEPRLLRRSTAGVFTSQRARGEKPR
jgi:hypothetical protein